MIMLLFFFHPDKQRDCKASTDYPAFTNARAAARSLTGEKAERAIHRSRYVAAAAAQIDLLFWRARGQHPCR
jgi:hypothetical protein